MVFRLTVLTALMASNISLVSGSGQCFCPVGTGRCKNSAGGGANPSKAYKKISLTNSNLYSGSRRCETACEDEGNTCQGWAYRDDGISLSDDKNNCHLFDYQPDEVKTNRDDYENWQCVAKGTLADTFSKLGPGKCYTDREGGAVYTQVRAYEGVKDSQNDGKIESVEECQEFCKENVEIDEYFFNEEGTSQKPGSACEGFDFVTKKCQDSSGNVKDRCSTNCYLIANKPTSTRTKPSRKQNYDNYSCYQRDCNCP